MARQKVNYSRLVRAIVDKCEGNQGIAAKRLGVTQPTVSRWMNDNMAPELKNHDRILNEAHELGIVNLGVLTETVVPIVGYVKAGGEAVMYSEGQGPFGEAQMPPKGTTEYTVAVVVRGDSMPGVAQDGWVLYYDTRHEAPTPDLMGKLCVAGLPDGRVVVKKLLHGTRAGLYHLFSVIGDPILDQPILWAAAVTWIQPQ